MSYLYCWGKHKRNIMSNAWRFVRSDMNKIFELMAMCFKKLLPNAQKVMKDLEEMVEAIVGIYLKFYIQ